MKLTVAQKRLYDKIVADPGMGEPFRQFMTVEALIEKGWVERRHMDISRLYPADYPKHPRGRTPAAPSPRYRRATKP